MSKTRDNHYAPSGIEEDVYLIRGAAKLDISILSQLKYSFPTEV